MLRAIEVRRCKNGLSDFASLQLALLRAFGDAGRWVQLLVRESCDGGHGICLLFTFLPLLLCPGEEQQPPGPLPACAKEGAWATEASAAWGRVRGEHGDLSGERASCGVPPVCESQG